MNRLSVCGFEGMWDIPKYLGNGPVAQLVRAPPCHGGGRGFESHPGRFIKIEYFYKNEYGVLAQLGEHLPYKQRVTGSSPVGPIHLIFHEYADVAQLAEQLICNQQVIGSSPIIGFAYGWIPEWPKGADCKSASMCFRWFESTLRPFINL